MTSKRQYYYSRSTTFHRIWWWYLQCCSLVGLIFHGNQQQDSIINNNIVLAFAPQSSVLTSRRESSQPCQSARDDIHSNRQVHYGGVILLPSQRVGYGRSILFLSSSDGQDSEPTDEDVDDGTDSSGGGSGNNNNNSASDSRMRIRQRVKALAKNFVSRPLALASTVPMPSAIAAVLKDASWAAVEQVEEALNQQRNDGINNGGKAGSGNTSASESSKEIINAIVNDAFAPMEVSLLELEASLQRARVALDTAKLQSYQAIEALQIAAIAQAEATARQTATAVAEVEQKAQRQVMAEIYSNAISVSGNEKVDLSTLTFDDVDYDSSEMSPPFLDPDSCLIPGEPVVRVEKAPENSRRIFAGIDIMASVDDVWNVRIYLFAGSRCIFPAIDIAVCVNDSCVQAETTLELLSFVPLSIYSKINILITDWGQVLTNYAELQNVVPNLVVNEVLDLYEGSPIIDAPLFDANAPVEIQCKQLSQLMKGSLLKQVGGAKVAGINFSAKTTIEVREWPEGLPDFAHFTDDMWDGKSREARAREYPKTKLKRYRFPRPFALSSLPTRDISMQSVVDDDGEFRMYQGVWRMQPLPGCAPPGKQAMRLSYAVEISPRAYLPVQLVEGRIVRDLCTNLEAIRNAVTD
jgi:hypothetical protein